MRILLVEDEPDMAQLIARSIGRQGFVVDQVGCLADALEAVMMVDYALILLDRRLPDGDGAESIPSLRSARPAVPVIILTALDSVAARIAGLEAGADDYLGKPFSLDELAARVRAALRRPGTVAAPAARCGNVTFEPSQRTVWVAGEPIVLTKRELALFETLVLRSGRVVQRAALANNVYGLDDDVQENAFDALISRLRRRLSVAGATARIHTVRGLGYMLRAEPA